MSDDERAMAESQAARQAENSKVDLSPIVKKLDEIVEALTKAGIKIQIPEDTPEAGTAEGSES
jgi:hypothetical protein